MRLKRVTAGMGHTFSTTTNPFARVLFLPTLDVRVMNVFNKPIHVSQIPDLAAFPSTDGDLFLKVIFVLSRIDWRIGDVTIGIGGEIRHAAWKIWIGLGLLDDGR